MAILTLLFAAGIVPTSASASSIVDVLGVGASSVRTEPIPGNARAVAVTYSFHGWHAAVVIHAGTGYTLLWHRALSGKPAKLDTVGPPGVFRVLDKFSNTRRADMYAYDLSGGSVRSAIAGDSDGRIVGDDGVIMHDDGFTVRVPDTGHTGSVPYRILTRYTWGGHFYKPHSGPYEPDYSLDEYPVRSGWVTNARGDITLLRLQVADTEPLRESGLMNQTALDPDSGMIFVWNADTHDSFWMENTPIPLSIAFLNKDGIVQETQEMLPETTDLHTPNDPYRYAIEANAGFFSSHHIVAGDRIHLRLQH